MSDNILTTRRSMFCYSTDGVQFSGKFGTREDAYIEAQHQEGDCRVSTGEVVPLDFRCLAGKAIARTDIAELMYEVIEEEIGDEIERTPSKESMRKFEALMIDRMAELMKETWGDCFGVENIETHQGRE